jgi:hypothetical protein
LLLPFYSNSVILFYFILNRKKIKRGAAWEGPSSRPHLEEERASLGRFPFAIATDGGGSITW